jgi:hypothetical protein
LRFLLTKVELEGRLSGREHLALTLCFDECWNYLDRTWVQKYGTNLVRIKFLIECYHRILKLGSDVKVAFGKISRGYQYRKFLHQPNAYFGRKEFFNLKNILVRINRKLERKSYSNRFVGVGYRDKGNARNTAANGTPSWQDVASSECIFLNTVPRGWSGPELAILSHWGRYPDRVKSIT